MTDIPFREETLKTALHALRRNLVRSALTTLGIVITITLVVINRANDTIAHRWADMSQVLEDAPLILIEDGVVHEDRMARMKIRIDDILENGRLAEGVERLDQIKHATWSAAGRRKRTSRT